MAPIENPHPHGWDVETLRALAPAVSVSIAMAFVSQSIMRLQGARKSGRISFRLWVIFADACNSVLIGVVASAIAYKMDWGLLELGMLSGFLGLHGVQGLNRLSGAVMDRAERVLGLGSDKGDQK